MVRSSVYDCMVTSTDVGEGKSYKNKLKRFGERTAPWGTPFGKNRVLDRVPL